MTHNETLRFKMRDAVFLDKRISTRAKLLYITLDDMAGYKGEAWPKQTTLGKMLGVSRRTVIRWLAELAEYVTILHRPGSSIYVLAWRQRKPIEAVTKMSQLRSEAVTPVSHQIGDGCHSFTLLLNQEIEPSIFTCAKCEDLGVVAGSGACDCEAGRQVTARLRRKRA